MSGLEENDHKPICGLKVLALGLPRSGSSSMAEALAILGYKDVLHGFNILDRPQVWSFVNRAADASFPALPTYTGKRLQREDWDELFGSSEASTDVAAVFATQLIEAYPEAKVIVVIREFDRWYVSIEAAVKLFWSFPCQLAFRHLGFFLDPCFGEAVRKIIIGFFEYTSLETFPHQARIVYDRHHCNIRQRVAPCKLLEYRLGEGWEPICKFLEKPVPDLPFPWLNEGEALRRRVEMKVRRHLAAAVRQLIPWVLGICTLLVALWMSETRCK